MRLIVLSARPSCEHARIRPRPSRQFGADGHAKPVEPPAEVTLDFSEDIEPTFSAIEVEDAKGARVDKGDVHIAPDNAKRLVVSINALEPGVYKVTWRVTSTDTHRSKGSFSFSIGK